jgi:hypothetical protein
LVPFAGVSEKLPSLQIVVVMAVTEGAGLMVTVTVKEGPEQLFLSGVTV